MAGSEAGFSGAIPATMRAAVLRGAGGAADVSIDEVAVPRPGSGEVLVRVHAAAITRDELEWPTDRLPAIPSYEASGVVAAVGPQTDDVTVGDEVYALTDFGRDGMAAEYGAVPSALLAAKPRTVDHRAAAAIPMGALTAWQGLFTHGGLVAGQRVMIVGAAGGVGRFATQLARWRGATVVAVVSAAKVEHARALGAGEVIDRSATERGAVEPVDLVFDTAGGDVLTFAASAVRPGGTLVSVAAEPPSEVRDRVASTYFIVEPGRDQLAEIADLVDGDVLDPAVDSVFPLDDARAAFERSLRPDTTGKIVIRIDG
jgi:NADPH:quinone reductase-like Zn-dependent oxidoreductase